MQRDDFTCRHCKSTDNFLNVHHLIYLPNCDPWEYDDKFLITLCEKCHKEEETLKDEDKLLLGCVLLSGIGRKNLYALAAELRRHLEDIDTRETKFLNLMEYLYEQ